MQRLPSRDKSSRPPAHPSKSFTRYEPSSPSSADRSSILASGTDPLSVTTEPEESSEGLGDDIFEAGDGDEDNAAAGDHDDTDDLPVEIQSLMERFIESLSLKRHPTPISADQLSELYQNFYAHVESQIALHIATLSSRLSRERSPAPSVSSMGSSRSRGGRKNSKPIEGAVEEPLSERQMLTATEITERKKAKRQLELKRLALEEAVERGVCEKVYSKIWRHKSTDDAERDEKVRSRAAALSIVGVDLKELLSAGSDADKQRSKAPKPKAAEEDPAHAQLADARSRLLKLNEIKYPLGKLQALTSVHKSIVEALSQMFPSTSSADEVLPTLIYSIITLPPSDIHLVSHLNFIQRFRSSNKIDGETAYCLTNLEAAISFLENVDMSSLRPEGENTPTSSQKEASAPMYRGLPGESPKIGTKEQEAPTDTAKSSRRLSSLLQSRPRSLEAASGMVSTGADVAYDTIHAALDGSMKFFFGKMKEKQSVQSPGGASADITVPKTLEDARKLVSTPPPLADDDASIGKDSLTDGPESLNAKRATALDLVAGRKAGRDRSAESLESAASVPKPAAPVPGFGAVESVRNLGNSLNPLKGLSAMGSFRGFTRSSPTPSIHGHSPQPSDGNVKLEKAAIDASGVGPPIQKFVDCKEAKELTFYDVELLLRDYQRLAGALGALQSLGGQ